MNFADNLRRYREGTGRNAKEFAKLAGIPYTTYHGYEAGISTPKYDLLCHIADLLQVSLDDLLGREGVQYQKAVSFFQSIDLLITTDKEGRVLCSLPSSEDGPEITFPNVSEFMKFYNSVYSVVIHHHDFRRAAINAVVSYAWETVKPKTAAINKGKAIFPQMRSIFDESGIGGDLRGVLFNKWLDENFKLIYSGTAERDENGDFHDVVFTTGEEGHGEKE